MSLTVGVDPAVAPGAIKELRAAMDELWKAFDRIHKAGDTLGNGAVWSSQVATEYQGKWGALSPVLMKAKSSCDDMNTHLNDYDNNIADLVADSGKRTK